MALLLGTSLLLAACGDSPTTTSGAIVPGTPAASSNAATTAASSATVGGVATTGSASTPAALITSPASITTNAASNTTTSAAGNTTTAAAATGATQVSANPCQDTDASAAPVASAPQPTTTVTTLADLPNLVYTGAKELKPSDTTNKGIVSGFGDPRGEVLYGKFTAEKALYAVTPDSYDKVEAFYRKLLDGAGWQLLKSESDASTKEALLVYQKGGSKLAVTVFTVADTNGYPPEFKADLKEGNSFVLIGTGRAVSAVEPTPFAIPGSPVAEVKGSQHKLATIELEKGGKIVIELCPNLAPKTVENFEKLATKNFYNGLNFHRVEPGFVVQGGDPKGDGTGGPGYQIPDEFTRLKKHLRGTVAMAHSSAPNSAGSQFYICLGAAPHLDGGYAIFGQVVEGLDLIDKIVIGDKMKSVTISVK